jgi:beta-glucosidase
MADWFADYAGLLASRFGDRVKDWVTMDEPASFIWGGHINGGSAPDRRDRRLGLGACHNAMRAHGLAVRAVRAEGGPGARVGISLNLFSLSTATDSDADRAAMKRLDAKKNRLFLDTAIRGEYSAETLEVLPQLKEWMRAGDMEQMKAPQDFLGVNYYHHLVVRASSAKKVSSVEAGAAPVYGMAAGETADVLKRADGLYDVLRRVHHEYGVKETVITENGLSRPEDEVENGRVMDRPRTEYLAEHLAAALRAIRDGMNLTGFYAWTLIDNFEWAHGYRLRFGLAHVDFATQKRTVKDSGLWYSRCAEANALIPAGTGKSVPA